MLSSKYIKNLATSPYVHCHRPGPGHHCLLSGLLPLSPYRFSCSAFAPLRQWIAKLQANNRNNLHSLIVVLQWPAWPQTADLIHCSRTLKHHKRTDLFVVVTNCQVCSHSGFWPWNDLPKVGLPGSSFYFFLVFTQMPSLQWGHPRLISLKFQLPCPEISYFPSLLNFLPNATT